MVHDHLDFPFSMIVNIPFVDTSVKNGATEFWLGTHLQGNKGVKDAKRDGPWIAPQYLERRGAECPPIRPEISKGSLLIRDMRLWHAGIANETPTPRIMLSLVNLSVIALMKIHFAQWYRNPMRLTFPEGSRAKLESLSGNEVKFMVDYIPDTEYNHMTMKVNVDNAGGNREMSVEEVAYTKRYGTVVQKLPDQIN